MTDSTTTTPLLSPSYDGSKSGSGARTGRGVEVRVREVRRRNWSTEERLRIVRETLEPGVIVQAVADQHGVSTGQLYTWRKQMLATAMAGFVPVEVVPQAPQLPSPGPAMSPDSCVPSGMIEITLPSGASIRITGCADAATLRVVLAGMGGR
ncbi:IS66-like element accessory protein TnpA [Falsiroseomonas tokyonensis]|uniref:Transposase n=1 Tax=Falsiroseomonas tokyonensis TaxID=430521 RepID=A0ABV7C3L4_9PROT|nr:transposase [Falsiroseomonas tokyonensis]MBU8542026.1 transposase [Falsiroseomonas tokyonensis]